MNNVNKTLYIPLFGKALVSKRGIILQDKKAEEIWESEKIELKGKSKSKWLAFYMGMRSAVFDEWVASACSEYSDCIVLHLGCGLDSRAERVKTTAVHWYDVDFDTVIDERRRYFGETDFYHMLGADLRDSDFVRVLPKSERAIVILEGVSMYLTNDELKKMLAALNGAFPHLSVLLDCYTPLAAKMSRIKNPIKSVGVSRVFGIKSPEILEENTGLFFAKEHEMTPRYLIDELRGAERFIFKSIYAGRMSKRLYKLYEYKS